MQRQTGSGFVKKIDFVFYHEREIRRAVEAARQDNPHTGKNGSGVADPTATEAIRNVTPLLSVIVGDYKLEWPEDWLRVVDATHNWCDRDRLIVAKDRYSGVDYRLTCAKIPVGASQYFRWLDDIRHHASLCAAQLGLIKVC